MIEQRQSWDEFFLGMARYVSTRSKDPSTKVGAVITFGKDIVSVGFNGFPEKMEDRPEWYEDRTEKLSRMIHAEKNAISRAKRDLTGTTMYTYPFVPCDRCFVHLLNEGIIRYVAPAVTNSGHIERWGPAFDRVRQYAADAGVELVEVDFK